MGTLSHDQALLLALLIASWELAHTIVATSTEASSMGSKDNFVISPHKTAVVIYNNLGPGLDLTVHCKSKDDDLGTQVIPNGKTYEWRFRVNFLGTTLFFCGLNWRDASGTYEIYKASRDLERCVKECNWRVFQEGVYGYQQGSQREDLNFTWGNHQNDGQKMVNKLII